MGDAEGSWQGLNLTTGHAQDRCPLDALLELYMNAVDAQVAYAKENEVAFQMPTIKVVGDSGVEIANQSRRGYRRTDFLMGQPKGAASAPDKLGRHGMGLKDAVAVLLRNGCSVSIIAQDRRVAFQVSPETGEISLRASPVPGTSGWLVEVQQLSNAPKLVQTVKSHFEAFADADMKKLLFEGDVKGVHLKVYKPNHKTHTRKPFYRGPENKPGVWVGPRFVRFANPSQVTDFGYHVVRPTEEIKKLISRDQVIPGINEPQIWSLLQALSSNPDFRKKAREALPGGFVRETQKLLGGSTTPPHGGGGGGGGALPQGRGDGGGAKGAQAGRVSFETLAAKHEVEKTVETTQAQWKEHGTDLLRLLNRVARRTFPEDTSAQVVAYGSMVYKVGTARSDVDVTLFLFRGGDDSMTSKEILLKFRDGLKALKDEQQQQQPIFNVVDDAIDARVPILKVQKNTPGGVHFSVDISVHNHSGVHKSHALREFLIDIPGATELAVLVKLWAHACNLNTPQHLASHGWMHLVARFCTDVLDQRANANEVGFFEWFVRHYGTTNKPWEILERESPWTTKENNVAERVNEQARKATVQAAQQAIRNLEASKVPWGK